MVHSLRHRVCNSLSALATLACQWGIIDSDLLRYNLVSFSIARELHDLVGDAPTKTVVVGC